MMSADDLLSEMRGELSVVRALHRGCDFEFNVAPDVLEQLKEWIKEKHSELAPEQSGVPMIRAWGIPIVVDEAMSENTFRVDWMPRQ